MGFTETAQLKMLEKVAKSNEAMLAEQRRTNQLLAELVTAAKQTADR